jgi:hypothetical protein
MFSHKYREKYITCFTEIMLHMTSKLSNEECYKFTQIWIKNTRFKLQVYKSYKRPFLRLVDFLLGQIDFTCFLILHLSDPFMFIPPLLQWRRTNRTFFSGGGRTEPKTWLSVMLQYQTVLKVEVLDRTMVWREAYLATMILLHCSSWKL